MTNRLLSYIHDEKKHLRFESKKVIDTCTDKVYSNLNEWFITNFQINESEFNEAWRKM